jgi:hypothetical protein
LFQSTMLGTTDASGEIDSGFLTMSKFRDLTVT